jgi:hypothetical protein
VLLLYRESNREPLSRQVLDAVNRIKERHGLDGDTITIDTKDPIARDYLDQVRKKIKEKWDYPCVKDGATPAGWPTSCNRLVSMPERRGWSPRCAGTVVTAGARSHGMAVYLLLRADRALGLVPEVPRDLDRLAAQHQPRGLQEHLMLRRSDLSLNDLDGEILPTQQPGHAVPHTRRALVGIHRDHTVPEVLASRQRLRKETRFYPIGTNLTIRKTAH